MTFSLRKQLEGEQRWETNNGNSLETRGHLHRLEHQVSSGQNCEFRIQNDNYDDYFDNYDDYFNNYDDYFYLILLKHQVSSCEAQFGHLFGIVRKEEDLAIKQQQQQQYFLQDLFYLLPYHHLEFPPSLKKLIIIDVDLEFSVDILRLYKYYNFQIVFKQSLQTFFMFKIDLWSDFYNFQALFQVFSKWGSLLWGHPVPILLWLL